jgi:probable rRNA maturation factor
MRVISSWRHAKKTSPDRKSLERLAAEAAVAAGLRLDENEIISVNFVGPRTMRRINREFLNHDYLTDVIFFIYRNSPYYMPGEDAAVEIFISPDIAEERAMENSGFSYSSELLLYMVHALLHAAGFNDAKPDEKEEMRRQEQRVISQLGKDADKLFRQNHPVLRTQST